MTDPRIEYLRAQAAAHGPTRALGYETTDSRVAGYETTAQQRGAARGIPLGRPPRSQRLAAQQPDDGTAGEWAAHARRRAELDRLALGG